MNKVRFLWAIVLTAALSGCREKYDPPVVSTEKKHLVVEGVLNAGNGPTDITISRTFKLDDTARITYENNAQVTVEGADNSVRPLNSFGNGIYHSPNLGLTIGQQYRLRIITPDGNEYLSDFVVAKQTPEIDSVGWKQTSEGVRFYVNTDDPTNNTVYYKWDFDETWEINTYYTSFYIFDGGIVRERDPSENVTICWKHNPSNQIVVGSTARLQSDVVFEGPINFIPKNDERLAVRYSVLLRQYAIDKAGFEFYELMKRNTESVGSVFDPQPSEVWGNIRCISDPSNMVIGYVSASTVEEKRMFVTNPELQNWVYPQYCPSTEIVNHPDSLILAYTTGLSPIDAIYSPNGFVIVAYLSASRPCVECTARGGSLVRPSFW